MESFEICGVNIVDQWTSDLLVVPHSDGKTFEIILDGVAVTTIRRFADEAEGWQQIDGYLDQETINKIGEAIENHYL